MSFLEILIAEVHLRCVMLAASSHGKCLHQSDVIRSYHVGCISEQGARFENNVRNSRSLIMTCRATGCQHSAYI
jgi:hypothetical protein